LTADNKVARRDLVANRTIGTNWLVESGLKAGERVVIEGLQSIRDGMTVRVAGGEQKPAAK
jgi:membrane fusion protein (multidrug efflux system)